VQESVPSPRALPLSLTNAESLVRAHVPDAFVDTQHAFQHSKKTYGIYRESSVSSIGQGPTKKAAWPGKMLPIASASFRRHVARRQVI
jgi:hypothetical protein